MKARPKMLLLDEPSMGLSPILVKEIFSIIQEVNRRALRFFWWSKTRNGPVHLQSGLCPGNRRIVMEGSAQELMENDKIKKAYWARKPLLK